MTFVPNRRQFVCTAAGVIASLNGFVRSADDVKLKTSGDKTYLFLDWFHVKKGDLQVTLDANRISPQGRKTLETYARDFKKTFDESGHGFRPVDVPFGIRVIQEPARRSQPWLLPDRPWETSVGSPTVIFENGRYRCWYTVRLKGEAQETTVDEERVMGLTGSALAYAESDDGLTWTKPVRNQFAYQGSRENNLVSPFNNGGAIFRDDHGPADERYKGFQFDALPTEELKDNAGSMSRYGLYGVTSPDGFVWTRNPKPLIRYFCDTVNVAGWDDQLKKYVGYYRHHLSGRAISRAETDDFWSWPAPQPLLHAGPLDGPAEDYYTNGYTTYPGEPSVRLLFPTIYRRSNDSTDVRLAISRDGRSYQWVSYEPIVAPGKAGDWDGGSIYAQPNLVKLPDGRLALPLDAYNTSHNEAHFKNLYRDFESKSAIAWALWDDARLAGIQAEELGQFTMNATVFQGKKIQLNVRTTRSGSVEVELREKGKPVPGFTFDDFVPQSGDLIWSDCRWKGEPDLSRFRGKYVELAIRLRGAKIFACRFAS